MVELLVLLAILFVSVAVLSRASGTVVDHLVVLSSYLRISHVAIGFIVLAVATALPELAVSIISSVGGEGEIAAGNVFGSNIANILLVLGAGAFIYGLKVSHKNLQEIGFLLLLTVIISTYIIFNSSIRQEALGLPEGIALLAIFFVYAWYIATNRETRETELKKNVGKPEAMRSFLFFGAGIIAVLISAGFVVDAAVKIAELAGVSESFIGATLIAVGTSLPEASICLQAIKKKKYGIALGDAIGSNVVALTLALGTAAAINPIYVQLPVLIAALLFAIIANVMLLYLSAIKKGIHRLGGAVFLGMYALFLAVIFLLQLREMGIGV